MNFALTAVRDGDALPDTGSFEQDLTAWASVIARDGTRPERVRYMLARRLAPAALWIRPR